MFHQSRRSIVEVKSSRSSFFIIPSHYEVRDDKSCNIAAFIKLAVFCFSTKWVGNNLIKDKLFVGIILYAGEIPVSFGNNLWAVPLGSLWS